MGRIAFTFKNPSQCDIVLFDPLNKHLLTPVLAGRDYYIQNPYSHTYPLTAKFLALSLLHLFKGVQLRVAINTAVLEIIRPKLVITYIDNSGVFQGIVKNYRKTRYIAIQNGNRLLTRDNVGPTREIYHDVFCCIGHYEIDQYKKHGAVVNSYKPIGTLINSYYERSIKTTRNRKRYRICLISQVRPGLELQHTERMNGALVLASYLQRYVEEKSISVVVAMRSHPDRNIMHYEWECEWYKRNLPCAKLFNNNLTSYTSYRLADLSELTVGMHSTAVRESFGRGNKILSCNYTEDSAYDFPVTGLWSITKDDGFYDFKKRIDTLLSMTEAEYKKIAGRVVDYLYNRSSSGDALDKVSKIIDDLCISASVIN